MLTEETAGLDPEQKQEDAETKAEADAAAAAKAAEEVKKDTFLAEQKNKTLKQIGKSEFLTAEELAFKEKIQQTFFLARVA